MTRKWHYLRHNAETRTPSRLAFLHVVADETKCKYNRYLTAFRLHSWHLEVYDKTEGEYKLRGSMSGAKARDLWTVLEGFCTKKRRLWLYCYDAAFTLTVLRLWDLLESGKWQLGRYVVSDPPVIVDATTERGRIRMVDLLNYWQYSLEDLSHAYSYLLPHEPAADRPWTERAAWGVEACRAVANVVLETVGEQLRSDYGNWSATGAGLAWNAYRHRFMRHPILVHNHHRASGLERDCLIGGRCEVWKASYITGGVYVLDVNSMYPAVMKDNLFPWRMRECRYGWPSGTDEEAFQRGHACAVVDLKTAKHEFPVRTDYGLAFATGSFRTCLCAGELQRAIRTGSIFDVHEYVTYEVTDLFSGFVEHFYHLRRAAHIRGNDAQAMLAKLFLVALPGKFGQGGWRWVDDDKLDPPFAFGEWYEATDDPYRSLRCRVVAWKTQRYDRGGLWYDACPAIAAFVNSYAREKLRNLRLLAGADNCYYCDTDSLHVSPVGHERLAMLGMVNTTELGKLKVVSRPEWASYRGPRDYETSLGRTTAGLPATVLVTPGGNFIVDQRDGLWTIFNKHLGAGVNSQEVGISAPNRRILGKPTVSGWVEPLRLPDDLELLADTPHRGSGSKMQPAGK